MQTVSIPHNLGATQARDALAAALAAGSKERQSSYQIDPEKPSRAYWTPGALVAPDGKRYDLASFGAWFDFTPTTATFTLTDDEAPPWVLAQMRRGMARALWTQQFIADADATGTITGPDLELAKDLGLWSRFDPLRLGRKAKAEADAAAKGLTKRIAIAGGVVVALFAAFEIVPILARKLGRR